MVGCILIFNKFNCPIIQQPMSKPPKTDKEIIQQLKEKLHRSFIHISDIEKLHQVQLSTQKQLYDNQIKQLTTTNENLLNKIKQLQKNTSSRKYFYLEGFDESIVQLNPKATFQQQQANISQDQTLNELIKRGQFNSQVQDLSDIYNKIIQIIPTQIVKPQVFQYLHKYAQSIKKIYIQNCQLKDQLFLVNQRLSLQQNKIQSIRITNQQLIKNQARLREDSVRLTQMYHQQLIKTEGLTKKLQQTKIITKQQTNTLKLGLKKSLIYQPYKQSSNNTFKTITTNASHNSSFNPKNANTNTNTPPIKQTTTIQRFPYRKLFSFNQKEQKL